MIPSSLPAIYLSFAINNQADNQYSCFLNYKCFLNYSADE